MAACDRVRALAVGRAAQESTVDGGATSSLAGEDRLET
jgi:hypothetical protein